MFGLTTDEWDLVRVRVDEVVTDIQQGAWDQWAAMDDDTLNAMWPIVEGETK